MSLEGVVDLEMGNHARAAQSAGENLGIPSMAGKAVWHDGHQATAGPE